MNRTFSKSPIRDFRSIIPIHMQIVALTSLFSLILAFLLRICLLLNMPRLAGSLSFRYF